MDNVYLDVDKDGNLIIMQRRQGEPEARIVLTPKQTTEMVDMLLGPKRVKTIPVDLSKLAPKTEKPN